jgi:hypothetical protein
MTDWMSSLDQELVERAAEWAELKDEPQLVLTGGSELFVVAEPWIRRAEVESGHKVPTPPNLISPTGVRLWVFRVPPDGTFGFAKLFGNRRKDWRKDVTTFQRIDGTMMYQPRPGEPRWYNDQEFMELLDSKQAAEGVTED